MSSNLKSGIEKYFFLTKQNSLGLLYSNRSIFFLSYPLALIFEYVSARNSGAFFAVMHTIVRHQQPTGVGCSGEAF